jgi:hypothetical protein
MQHKTGVLLLSCCTKRCVCHVPYFTTIDTAESMPCQRLPWANKCPPHAGAPTEPNSILCLFTDGRSNCGVNADHLARLVASILACSGSKQRVKIHIVGLGADHNTRLLQTIADAAGGRYFHISSMSEVTPELVSGILDGQPIRIKDLMLTLSPGAPEVTVLDVQSPFPTTSLQGGAAR